MNAVHLFETLGKLDKVRWLRSDGCRVRVTKRHGQRLTVQVQLSFCKTWISDGAWSLDAFLASHKPVR